VSKTDVKAEQGEKVDEIAGTELNKVN